MATVNGKPIRQRGGSNFRPSRKPKQETPKPWSEYRLGPSPESTSALVADAAKYYECAEAEETAIELKNVKAALSPAVPALRESLTKQQHLALFPREVEREPRLVRQSYKQSGYIKTATVTKQGLYGKPVEVTVSAPRDSQLAEVTNEVIVRRPERTLLRRNIPDQLKDLKLKRETARSKRIKSEPREEPAVIEIPLDDELDLDL